MVKINVLPSTFTCKLVIKSHTHTRIEIQCVRAHGLLLQGEAEVAGAALDLVLGLQVVHALRGDTVNRQNQVSNRNTTFSCLPSISELRKHKKQHHKLSL